MMNTFLPECRVLLITCRWRCCYLLGAFIYNSFNMLLLDCFSWDAERPAISSWGILVKCPWLSLISIGAWQASMFLACIVILKSLLMGAECIGRWVQEVLSPVEFTWLVKGRPTSIDGVWLYHWETWVFRETISSFWWGIRQSHR